MFSVSVYVSLISVRIHTAHDTCTTVRMHMVCVVLSTGLPKGLEYQIGPKQVSMYNAYVQCAIVWCTGNQAQ